MRGLGSRMNYICNSNLQNHSRWELILPFGDRPNMWCVKKKNFTDKKVCGPCDIYIYIYAWHAKYFANQLTGAIQGLVFAWLLTESMMMIWSSCALRPIPRKTYANQLLFSPKCSLITPQQENKENLLLDTRALSQTAVSMSGMFVAGRMIVCKQHIKFKYTHTCYSCSQWFHGRWT